MPLRTPLPAETALDTVRLRVGDRTRSLSFWNGLLGFDPIDEDADGVVLGPRGGPGIIRLDVRPGTRARGRGTLGLYHVAILYPDRVALALAVRRLMQERWPFEGFSDHGVSEASYLADPDGNGLELYADRPRATWRREGRIAMTTLPLDLADLLAQANGHAWAGADPRACVGHVHYHVADLARAERFWADGIGLDIVTRDYPGALFMSAGGYHHHVAVNTWAMQRRRPGEEVAGLIDVTLRVPDTAARAALRERLAALGIAIDGTADRFRVEDFEGNGVVIRG